MKKSYVEIFVCLDQRDKAQSLFDNLSHVVYFDTYEALTEKLTRLDYGHPHIVVVDCNYLLSNDNKVRSSAKNELMYKGASVGVYGNDIPLNIKEQLYAFEFKGIFDERVGDQKQILCHMIQRSNFYAATFENNFIKGILKFHNIVEESRRSLYLLNYLVKHYKIPNQDASSIRLAFVFLMLAFHEDKVFQTSQLLKTVFISQEASTLFQNYMVPRTFSEIIVSQLLLLNQTASIKKFTQYINTKNIPTELSETITQFENSKAIIISSYQDINFFWEEINTLILEKHFFVDNTLEQELNCVYEVMVDSLLHLNFFFAGIKRIIDDKLVVQLSFRDHDDNISQRYLNTLREQCSNVSLHLNEMESSIEVVVSCSKKIHQEEKIEEPVDTVASPNVSIIDTSGIDKMHYKDIQKISASEFLKDFEVEQYLLDELNENESEIKNILFLEEELSQNIIDSVVETLQRYVRVLHGTIEFEDIAFSLSSLAEFLSTLSIDTLDENKKNTLRFYIHGLINDLSSWKQYIFIEPNTPDIHYLDASLLENCAEIEKFITQKNDNTTSIEDDEMEFF